MVALAGPSRSALEGSRVLWGAAMMTLVGCPEWKSGRRSENVCRGRLAVRPLHLPVLARPYGLLRQPENLADSLIRMQHDHFLAWAVNSCSS